MKIIINRKPYIYQKLKIENKLDTQDKIKKAI